MSVSVADLVEEFERLPEIADPYPVYAQMREMQPVLRTGNCWYVTPYVTVREVLRNDTVFANDHMKHAGADADPYLHDPAKGSFSRVYSSILIHRDGTDHRRLRGLVNKLFTPRAVANFREEITDAIRLQLSEAGQDGNMDLIGDFAMPLPTRIILRLFGIPYEEAYRFYETTDIIIPPVRRGSPAEWFSHANSVVERHAAYIRELAEKRKARPATDVLSQLVGEDIGDKISDTELIGMVMFAITAGYETTANTFSNGVYWLLRNPDQLERVRADRSLVPQAVEEILRYDVATRGATRYAADDTVLGDAHIRRGDKVMVSLHAANRDPDKFDQPDRFDVGRAPNDHLAFAAGPHACLGSSLARLEMSIALEEILDRYSEIRLQSEPEWRKSFTIRGLESLPLTLRR
jgi:cytochrome P450